MNIGSIARSTFGSMLLTVLVSLPAVAQTPVTAAAGLQTLPSVTRLSLATAATTSAPSAASSVTLAGTAIGLNRDAKVASAGDYTAYPVLNVGAVPPLVMFVMSRDEQLFIKAYADYTDLDGDGKIDSTYNNDFDYSGYFDSGLCYDYEGGQFKAGKAAVNHQCVSGNPWSGNFLNWVTMSRLDVLRFVLYGGKRSTDTATSTVLERANIPNDLHAWAKVYSADDVNQYTPFSQEAGNRGVAFCNASVSSGGAPQMRVAQGNWSEWASTALRQCDWKADASTGSNGSYDDVPSQSDDGGAEYTVRVEVCDPDSTVRESFCQRYQESDGTISYKPVGLLQRYGENGQMRFGLLTGSFSAPRSGGVLRRNIGKLAGNGTPDADGNYSGCVTGDEIDLSDGTFCNQDSGDAGIINTLDRLKLTKWNYSSNWSDCNTYGILNRNTGTNSNNKRLNDPGTSGGASQNCSAWGNPLSEMYAEALRYIAADGAPTAAFNKSGDLSGLPSPAWQDPYGKDSNGQPRNPYCAACSIIVLSTGLNSFDSDELPVWTKAALGIDAAAETSSIGADEGINGGDYLIGRVVDSQTTLAVGNPVNTYEDLCESRTVTNLSLARGICPDIPSMEGSYLIAGLAYQAWTQDMRPNLKKANGTDRPTGFRNTIQTYAIALAENLPKFQIPVADHAITLAPLCQANNSGSAGIDSSGWRSCYLGAVGIGTKTSRVDTRYIYGRPLRDDAKAGSFSLVWEDSLWGNDHDNDVVSMLTYCVGSGADGCGRSTGLPMGALEVPKLCFYEHQNYGGDEFCPGNKNGDLDDTSFGRNEMSSLRVPAGYTVTLCGWMDDGECKDQHTYTSDTSSLGGFNDEANTWSITGGPVPPVATGATYDGYDICWHSDSPICTDNDGKPPVAANQVLVRVENLAAYAGNAMLTGYTITGSDQDGVKKLTLRPGGSDNSLLSSTLNIPGNWYKPKVVRYTVDPEGGASQLENPLFYTAKYGGFTDRNADGKPDQANEWDQVDNDTGDAGSDGLPDNFFQVRNPAQLGARLSRAFNDILKRSGSGTAAAVVSNSANGIGLTYQALYQSERSDDEGRTVHWTGTINGLWTDSEGYLRGDADGEQSDGSHQLGGYDVDPVIVFYTDPIDSKTKFYSEIMPASDDGRPVTTFDPDEATKTSHDLKDLKAVWSAEKGLWDVDLQTLAQRDYDTVFSDATGRYIFTWIDVDHDGVVDDGEQLPFVWGTDAIDADNYRFLNTSSEAAAEGLVNWIRGTEITTVDATGAPNWRSRTVNDDNGTLRVMRLGDIVNSTPVVVGTPAEAFDLLYNDTSYGKFRAHYRNRRQVVYVGANDGMLHAFNAGFYNADEQRIQEQPTSTTAGTPDTSFTAQPLGAELWAYIPGNLLPHLRWLADPNYGHMYYVDGGPIAQDVRIFGTSSSCETDGTGCVDDAGHVDGWGTVLIVPFRFGGGPISVPTGDDGASGWQNSYSAYVVLDITNPENPPVVLAELTNTELAKDADGNLPATDAHCSATVTVTCATLGNIIHTYTSSLPAEAMFRNSADSTPSKFFLFTGSGTTDNGGTGATEGGAAASTAALKIRAYDLADVAAAEVTPEKVFDFTNTGSANAGAGSFAGDLIASDFNLDGLSEGLYFGSVRGLAPPFGGSLWKLNFTFNGSEDPDPAHWTQQQVLSDLDRPVTAHPTVGLSANGKPMVFTGTGRAYTKDDLASTRQQRIIGMLDTSLLQHGSTNPDPQYHTLPLTMSDLVDVTDVQVSDDESVTGMTGSDTFSELVSSFDDAAHLGWYINLQHYPRKDDGTTDTSKGEIPAERVVSSQALLGGVLLTTTFLPGTDTCTDVGRGRLYGVNYKTGTADPTLSYFGTSADGKGNGTGDVVNRSTELGPGLPAAPSLHVGGKDPRKFRACVQTSTGAIICKDITTLKSVQSGEISWREPLDK